MVTCQYRLRFDVDVPPSIVNERKELLTYLNALRDFKIVDSIDIFSIRGAKIFSVNIAKPYVQKLDDVMAKYGAERRKVLKKMARVVFVPYSSLI